MKFGFSQRADRLARPPISYLMAQAVTNPHLISLAAGLVDYQTLPAQDVAAALGEILAEPASARAALQYGTTPGLLSLREALLEHLCELDGCSRAEFDASCEQMIITTGSQQLLYMLAEVLLDPGDIVVCSWPSYFVYTGALDAFGAQLRCVDIDEQGMIPESLDETLSRIRAEGRLGRVKMVYLVDYHQNPTGITLAEGRRGPILEIVRKYSTEQKILLVEDAAYRELTYEGAPPRSIRSLDGAASNVALIQTFSKPLAPGLKTGYGLLPASLVEPVTHTKGNHDFGSANFCQHLIARVLARGDYQKHLDVLRARYATKRDAMLAALDEHLGDFAPGETHWTHPAGGLYIWLTLPAGMDTGRDAALFEHAVAEGVLYVPGQYCYGPDPTRTAPVNTLRLSFGVAEPEQIRCGVERLARAIRATAESAPGMESRP